MLRPWWPKLALRRTGLYRRDRERRLTALRRFAASHGWNITGLTADLSACCLLPPLEIVRSAQAELTVTGEWQGRTALVASVLVQSVPASSAHSDGRARDIVVLLAAMRVGRNDRQFIASRTASAIDVTGISGSVDVLLQPLRTLLGVAARSSTFREGDTLKLGEVDLALAHQTRARERPLDVVSRLDLLGDVAGLLASG